MGLSKRLTTIVASMPLPPDRRSCADPSRICPPLARTSPTLLLFLLLPVASATSAVSWLVPLALLAPDLPVWGSVSPLSLSQSLTRSQSQRLVCFSWPFLYL